MLRFQVFRDGEVPSELNLGSAYLVGADNVPIRGEFTYTDGEIRCRKRAAGPSALALMWEIKGFGSILLDTVRLPERPGPYILNVELARGRMMKLLQKREDWGLLDVADAQLVNDKFAEARELLIQAMENLDDPPVAAKFADRCLALALPLSEQAAVVHAELLLHRRIATRSFPRNVFGSHASLPQNGENYRRKILAASDFVSLPLHWKTLEPQQQAFNWGPVDEWADFLRRAKLPMVGGPLVQFSEAAIPDWLYIWEHDYETVRSMLYEHIERVVGRYGSQVVLWNVLSSLHVNAHFSFTFDQLMDLTRLAISLVKKLLPAAQTMIEITQPWGEYYAGNQRSIPPLIYAEMAVQSGIPFELFGLQLCFGLPRDGCWQRDLFQISMMLDRFATMGKPLVITRMGVPSGVSEASAGSGQWRKPWNEQIQAKWLEAVTNIVLSKPFVEAVCWCDLADEPTARIPGGGLLAADLNAKASYQTWTSMRKAVMAVRQGAVKTPADPAKVAGAAAAPPPARPA